MKYGLFFLRFSIVALLVSLGLYLYGYCLSYDGLDPIELETVIIGCHGILGILLCWLLVKKSNLINPIWFWADSVLILLIFTFPAIITDWFMLSMMYAG